ncbi:hypothetical protein [Haloarchaeobius sp. DYHT-AS-18]|uniref:hypothetical protein n=1 Tax=Haloarchaeobius sp. DYHT-AS-18 TaxID=3446117 RepID=UPI003EBDFEA3
MPYELDTTPDGTTETETDSEPTEEASDTPSLGMTIPEEHVGAFVAEALDDPERSTEWRDVVDAMVAPSARDVWDTLSPTEQATEVLTKAAEYDRRATERFDDVSPTADQETVQPVIDEGLRCRRNADTFRDGVAAAYSEGVLDDDALVEALRQSAFDTALIAEREDYLERLDSTFDIDFRPYGGTLMDDESGPAPTTEHGETW